jgi:hypothetical protein
MALGGTLISNNQKLTVARPQTPNARVLDLYHGIWDANPLRSQDLIISADEKTSIQARRRLKSVTAPTAGRYGRVEHEYGLRVKSTFDFW